MYRAELNLAKKSGNKRLVVSVWQTMTIARTEVPTSGKPLRLWPGVAIVALQWLLRFGVPLVDPDGSLIAVLGGLAGGVALVVWWAFFSRAPRSDRFGGVVLMILALLATSQFIDVSIATGAQGMLFVHLAAPGLCLAFVAWPRPAGGSGTGRGE